MLASLPPLIIVGGIQATILGRTASHSQTAYAKAAIVVEQTIGSIRTVCYTATMS